MHIYIYIYMNNDNDNHNDNDNDNNMHVYIYIYIYTYIERGICIYICTANPRAKRPQPKNPRLNFWGIPCGPRHSTP